VLLVYTPQNHVIIPCDTQSSSEQEWGRQFGVRYWRLWRFLAGKTATIIIAQANIQRQFPVKLATQSTSI